MRALGGDATSVSHKDTRHQSRAAAIPTARPVAPARLLRAMSGRGITAAGGGGGSAVGAIAGSIGATVDPRRSRRGGGMGSVAFILVLGRARACGGAAGAAHLAFFALARRAATVVALGAAAGGAPWSPRVLVVAAGGVVVLFAVRPVADRLRLGRQRTPAAVELLL